jgi:hypothetical protein
MGTVKSELLARLNQYMHDPLVGEVRVISNIQDHAAARNELVMFHDVEAFTHLLMLDSDTVPPIGFLEKMLAADSPVVSAVTHVWRAKKGFREPKPMLALWEEYKQSDGTVIYVQCEDYEAVQDKSKLVTGCFCMLIESQVFVNYREKFGLPFFKTEYLPETQEKTCSEDIWFCRNLHKMGVPIKILPDVVCEHFKTVSLADIARYGQIRYLEGLEDAAKETVTTDAVSVYN